MIIHGDKGENLKMVCDNCGLLMEHEWKEDGEWKHSTATHNNKVWKVGIDFMAKLKMRHFGQHPPYFLRVYCEECQPEIAKRIIKHFPSWKDVPDEDNFAKGLLK